MVTNLHINQHTESIMPTINHVSTESIAFQNDVFAKQIEDIIKEIESKSVNLNRQQIQKSPAIKQLEKLVFGRLGIKITIETNTTCPGAIMVFPVNRNHVLLNPGVRDNYSEKEQARLTKEFNELKGYVSLKDARVGGIFSTYMHKLYCDIPGNIKMGLTAGEITAIILHELGHAFTYYELSDRLMTTNQILADLAVTTKSGADSSKRIYLFKELSDKLKVKESTWDSILEEPNRVIFGTKLFKEYVISVKSLMSNGKYDETASEQLADNFAARFGMGRELILGLDKLSSHSPERNKFYYYLATSIDFLYTVVWRAAVLFFSIMSGLIPLVVYFVIVYSIIIVVTGSAFSDMTYDILKTRYIRIRQQSIARISQTNLNKDDLRQLVDTIHQMDSIIKETQVFSLIVTKISNFLVSVNRDVKNDVAFQGLLEATANNDLFLKSAELKLI